MTRRRQLCSLLAFLLAAAPAAAQEAVDRGAGAPAAAQEAVDRGAGAPAAAPPPKPRQNRRRARRRDPAEGAQQQAAPAPEPAPRLEAAPVPNRDLEAPRAPGTDRTRLSPSVIHRPLPGQGMAAEGAQNIQEERLFFPAPGARLNVPFSY
jgi:hypothetical protein